MSNNKYKISQSKNKEMNKYRKEGKTPALSCRTWPSCT